MLNHLFRPKLNVEGGPIEVIVKNQILQLMVIVGTRQRYGFVKKCLVINLLMQFKHNLDGSKFLILSVIENARERTFKIKLGKLTHSP